MNKWTSNPSVSVDLLLTSGHELGSRGGYFLAESYAKEPECVIHLGSCIANFDAKMTCICSADSVTVGRIAGELKRLGMKPAIPSDHANAENWIGEFGVLGVEKMANAFYRRTGPPFSRLR